MGYFTLFSLETWILLITFICLFVMYGYSTYGIFEKLGVPALKPYMYFGTVGRLHKIYFEEDCINAKKFGRIWGVYELKKPMIAVMEPEMLKTILVKECFTYFTNRRNFPLSADLHDGISLAQNDTWRRIRNSVSPCFTSGKLKEIFGIMKHHSSKLTACLQSKAHNKEVITVKDFFGSFTIDVMASCLMSVDLNTIHKSSDPIVTHAKSLFKVALPLYVFQACFPFLLPLLELMRFSLFNKNAIEFFRIFVEKIREERTKDSKKLTDMLQSMIDTQTDNKPGKEKGSKRMTDHEISTQVAFFIAGGYDTSANTLVFLAYNLAQNPEVMKRLQEEIDATFPDQGEVQYEALLKMEYLDCVVNETLRLYPPIPRLEREAKETVMVNGLKIPKDMLVIIPIYALHRDPEFWPEPEVFKPDRFNAENKEDIKPYSYLPFGAGPRNCIGFRLALMMVKLALVEVLRNNSFSVCEETEIPLKMDPAGLVSPLKPIKLRIVTRSN